MFSLVFGHSFVVSYGCSLCHILYEKSHPVAWINYLSILSFHHANQTTTLH